MDEVQDINFASGRLVHALDGGRGIVWAVGDPRQSIYRFRGASPVNMYGFTSDYPGAVVMPLETNYRSVEDVVEAGRAVAIPMPPGPDGQPLDVPALQAARGQSGDAPAVEMLVAGTGADERAAIVERIAAELAVRPPGEIAVLCRTTAQSQEVSDALEVVGIENDWAGALEERTAFKDLVGVLLLAADDPQGLVRVARLPDHHIAEADLRLLVAEARHRGRSALAALYAADDGEIAGLSDEGRAQARRLKALARKLRRAPTPCQALAAYLFEESPELRALVTSDTPAARRRLATLGQVGALCRDFEVRSTLAGGSDVDAFLDFVRICLESGDLGLPDEVLMAPDVVHVLTVHRSKGLEWPVVFVPNLAKGRFPLGDHDPLPLPPGLVRGATGEDEAVEEHCLFYVAVTRARDHLVLSRAEKYGRRSPEPAAFLRALLDILEPAGRVVVLRAPAQGEDAQSVASANGPARVHLGDAVPFTWLQAYEDCGQRFKYEHVYGLRGEEQGSLAFHATVDAVLIWMAGEGARGRPPTVPEAVARLSQEWDAAGLADHWFGSVYRRRADEIIAALAGRLTPGACIEVRQRAFLEIDGYRVEVMVDEHELRNELHIYRRYHYGQPATSHKEDHRLALYAALHQQEEGDEAPYELRLHYPLLGIDETVQPSATVIRNRRTKMEKLARAIEAGVFEPKPNTRRWPVCPFNCICLA